MATKPIDWSSRLRAAVSAAAGAAAVFGRAAAEAALRQPPVRRQYERAQAVYGEARRAAESRFERIESQAWAWIRKAQEEARRQARQAERRIESRDHYATLGLKAGADLEAVKKAYRAKMRANHPDRFANEPARESAAHAESQRIIEAYNQLSALLTGREGRREDRE